jgi:hypothetical protein
MLRTLSLTLLFLALPAHAWVVTPRLGVGLAVEHTDDALQGANVPISLGVALQPEGGDMVAPFVSPQVDIELPGEGDASYVPTLRIGLLVRDESPEYLSALMAWAQVYVLAGWRLPGGSQSAGSRIGVGIASPIALALTVRALEAGVPIPNSVEFVIDGLETLDPVGVFRFGFAELVMPTARGPAAQRWPLSAGRPDWYRSTPLPAGTCRCAGPARPAGGRG